MSSMQQNHCDSFNSFTDRNGISGERISGLLSSATHLARTAGQLLLYRLGSEMEIGSKSGIEVVTELDTLSEKIIVQGLEAISPDIPVLSEEKGGSRSREGLLWVIDPLDGTTNYSRAYPCFAVSIGLISSGESILGVVYNPNLDEVFTAVKGCGAFLNGKRLSVTKTDKLSNSFLATGFPYDLRISQADNLDAFSILTKRARAIRRNGAASLDLAYVACGRFDGFWEIKLKAWDTAAGVLLVTEAGGKVTRYDGSPYSIFDNDIVASNGKIHEELVSVLRYVKR